MSLLWKLSYFLAVFSLVSLLLDGPRLKTTVIILNWSRLPNVKHITSEICSSRLLQDAVKEIIVWNNNPKRLSRKDFLQESSCPSSALRIINSPENLYFQARFMACAKATTPYCFIQDDDYLIAPDVIHALSRRIDEKRSNGIHLQPPHELLTSELRTLSIPHSLIHTTFAWFGYGTIIKRSRAIAFLDLLDKLELSDEQHKMADNYYTILGNEVPERWVDESVELGGGQPFTVGTEGEERNNWHIVRAAKLLDSLVEAQAQSAPHNATHPFVASYHHDQTQSPTIPKGTTWRTACRNDHPCVVETSIRLLPASPDSIFPDFAQDILSIERDRRDDLGGPTISHFLDFPLSHSVDGRWDTSFRSPGSGGKGEWVAIDLLENVVDMQGAGKFVMVVGSETEETICSSVLETSLDGVNWAQVEDRMYCKPFTDSDDEFERDGPVECTALLQDINPRTGGRWFRVRLLNDVGARWNIFEISVVA